jgi:predicted permease
MPMLALFKSLRNEMKTSRYKIWLRAALFVQFCGIFGFYLFRDISNGHFNWGWVFFTCGVFVPIGFLMSRIVPMQVNREAKVVILSLDRVYLILIWILVAAKLVTGHIPSLVVVADVIMCGIVGIMSGRLGGIGVRVRRLKIQYGLLPG